MLSTEQEQLEKKTVCTSGMPMFHFKNISYLQLVESKQVEPAEVEPTVKRMTELRSSMMFREETREGRS